MNQLGHGPERHLYIKISPRNFARYRVPTVLLIGQLKHVYIDGGLEEIDAPQYLPKILRKTSP
jgi:peptide/nickel transport system substrate-binding protein